MCFASLGKRLVEAVFISIFCIITINFILIRFMPGDPVVHIIGEDEYLRLEAEAPEVIEEVRREYGLDKPLPVQYITYLQQDAAPGLREFLPYQAAGAGDGFVPHALDAAAHHTRHCALLSVLGGGLGLRAGWKKGGLLDTIASPIMLFLNTIPTNCMAILFLMVFAFQMGLFPISGITSGGLRGWKRQWISCGTWPCP